jgi:hypothetical protein
MWHASGKRCTEVSLEKFKGKRPFGTLKNVHVKILLKQCRRK